LVEEFRNTLTLGKTARAYRLSKADVTAAADAISGLLPNVKDSIDKSGRSLVVVATEADQQAVAQTLEEIDLNAPNAAVSAIYGVPSGDATALSTALKGLVPSATYVADSTGKSLLVLATPEEQVSIKRTVDQWSQDPNRALSTKVYAMNQGEPQAALTVLQKLLPGATIAVDANSRSLVATATSAQHELIEQTVTDLESASQAGGGAEMRTYPVKQASLESLVRSLQSLFKGDAQVGIVADQGSNAVIAVARPRQHAMITQLIAATDATAEAQRTGETLEIYPLANVDGKSLMESLNKLFEGDQPKPQISFDSVAQQVLAIASQKQHELIRTTLSQMQFESQEFELFHLRTLDPYAAQSAIQSLFRDEPKRSAPSIDVDFDNGTLLIRATASQLVRMRALLVKLGESEADLTANPQQRTRMRVLPVGGGVDDVLKELEAVWPKLHGNELRVIRPPAAPSQPSPPVADEAPPRINGPSASVPEWGHANGEPATMLRQEPDAAPANDADETPRSQEKPPILIIPGDRQLTIVSSDSQALDEFEQVLRTLLGPGAIEQNMGNFQTFRLRNAGAEQVAAILKDLFEKMPSRQRTPGAASGTPLLVAADDRLNLVVVHGSRTDREVIGHLIQVLDSLDMTDALSINQPIIVPVRNTDADRILAILNNVYRTQLSSGGGRKPVPIPEGLPLQLASLLQQVNVATSGPILTLGVDTVTNSIIIFGPPQLRDQVKATITQLDRAAETEPGEEIRIIQLQKMSPARIQRVLDTFFKSAK
jgi:type II secretory pathway component GspD/PulD (secretin)